ncbi:hypothetical protein ASPSYDRAFT_728587 [Aspergillus sydowii CBS 593.65]|uniref:Uncharacterized protein n=1 Tax=Aspergillus sydowii CBS 593.65 TaxID=1036612 RepID=A0A1L9TLY2_9EURO|nr:uncharacterized protein ASPSYDRAFT_728587 [Aspergillus sydowii CBS 593.65]OJJ60293.1 hypothetical protein ASPSYDRAFT_728587 [Aspergillus sydowii CBS 593.65]
MSTRPMITLTGTASHADGTGGNGGIRCISYTTLFVVYDSLLFSSPAPRPVLPIEHAMHEHVPNWKYLRANLTRPVSDRSTLHGVSGDNVPSREKTVGGDIPAAARDVIRIFNILTCIKCVPILSGGGRFHCFWSPTQPCPLRSGCSLCRRPCSRHRHYSNVFGCAREQTPNHHLFLP